ncbi:alpha/beta hydrolase [Aquiflexum gelatinilyticum]|uniref:Esterase family protein n=1 Tax=Aquiflexum gelatinilyticum TaxID=2961943 RepID=A0A9X2P5U9_9BACT|nr:alpha/beta hydrolase family protein [Aquiflexum gelatinilyticum]MCR9014082.1 esterase family protein [Aquiflexum gelatinilyticum]
MIKKISLTSWIFLLFQNILFSQVDTIEVFSQAMNKSLKAAVVKPEGYSENNKSYPTIFLLHGGSGSFSDWHKKTTEPNLLNKLANQYEVIIVTPGVGPSSYYYDSPILDSVKYETYFIEELIPFIDKNYRTINNRNSRAITGLSMGGHGSLMLSAKHPELFIAAGSMSGVMNIDTRMWKVSDEFRKLRLSGQKAMLGEINYDSPFTEYTVVGLVEKMKDNGISLIIDCGVDDFLLETNRQIHQLLLQNQTPHEYTERPGAHTWQYWTEALPYHLLFINRVLIKQP